MRDILQAINEGSSTTLVNESKIKAKHSQFTDEQIKILIPYSQVMVSDSTDLYKILWAENTFTKNVWYKNYYIEKYRGSLNIYDTTNALKRGGKISRWGIYSNYGSNEFDICITNFLRDELGSDSKLEDLIKFIENSVKEDLSFDIANDGTSGVDAYMKKGSCGIKFTKQDDIKSTAFYSPKAINKIKPLTNFPTKWKVNDLIKVIVNNQYTYLGLEGRYTDDYAFDAAYNYGKTDFINPIELVEDMINSPRNFKAIFKRGVESDIDGEVVTLSFGSSNTDYLITVNLSKPITNKDVLIKYAKNKKG